MRVFGQDSVQTRPENVALQAQIEKVEDQLERLRERYVLGDFARDEYMAARAGKMAEMAELEKELGGADYPLEAVLTRINRMGDILRDGTRKQQKRAINLLFDKILVGTLSKIKGVELQDWAQPLFADLLMVSGDTVCPQGSSNSCRRTYEGAAGAVRWAEAEVQTRVQSQGSGATGPASGSSVDGIDPGVRPPVDSFVVRLV